MVSISRVYGAHSHKEFLACSVSNALAMRSSRTYRLRGGTSLVVCDGGIHSNPAYE